MTLSYAIRLLMAVAFLGLCLPRNGYAQHPAFTDTLISELAASYPKEMVWLQTDQEVYLTGSPLYFTVSLLDAETLSPSRLSGYVYIELLDLVTGKAVAQRILKTNEHRTASGYLLPPSSLLTGSYELVAYTKSLMNLSEAYYFRKKITLLALGSELSGLEEQASFSAKPEPFLAAFIEPNLFRIELPEPLIADQNWLVGYHAERIVFSEKLTVEKKSYEISLPQTEKALVVGVHNGTNWLVQRPIQNTFALQKADLAARLTSSGLPRSEVSLSFSVDEPLGEMAGKAQGTYWVRVIPAELALTSDSTSLFDRLQWQQVVTLLPAHQQVAFLQQKPFRLNAPIAAKKPSDWHFGQFPTERDAYFLSGKVTYNGKPLHQHNGRPRLFYFTDRQGLYGDYPEGHDGNFVIKLPGRFTELNCSFGVYLTENDSTSAFEFRINQFAEHNGLTVASTPRLNKNQIAYFNRLFTQKVLSTKLGVSERLPSSAHLGTADNADAFKFFGSPHHTIDLTKYIELPSMEEVSRELLPGVKTRFDKTGNATVRQINVISHERGKSKIKDYFTIPPMLTLNGVPFFNENHFAALNPSDLEEIKIFQNPVRFSDFSFGGSIEITTRIPIEVSTSRGAVVPVVPASEETTSSPDQMTERHLPDFRFTVFWKTGSFNAQPQEVRFWHADDLGKFVVQIGGITRSGKPFFRQVEYEINR